jgi:hypothetical protein
MLTDRQTDTTKLIVAFRNFAKEPKKCKYKAQQQVRMLTEENRVRPQLQPGLLYHVLNLIPQFREIIQLIAFFRVVIPSGLVE